MRVRGELCFLMCLTANCGGDAAAPVGGAGLGGSASGGRDGAQAQAGASGRAGTGGAAAAAGASGVAGMAGQGGSAGAAGGASGGGGIGGAGIGGGASALNKPALGGAPGFDGVLPFTPDSSPSGAFNGLKATLVWASPDKSPSLNGPVWLARDHVLLFTDNGSGKILQRDAAGAVTTWGEFPGRPVGLAIASENTLVACEVGARRVVTIDLQTKKETLVVDSVDGHAFSGPWECDVGNDGTIYFTDPNAGAARPIYSAHGNQARLLATLNWELGVHLNLGQDKLLSPADWPGHVVTGLPLRTDGSVGDRIRWGEMRREGGAGMCVDRAGNVYVTGIQGVEVFKGSDGSRYDGFVWVNADGNDKFDRPTNCTFGDDDGKTLYITRPQALMRARVDIPGLPN